MADVKWRIGIDVPTAEVKKAAEHVEHLEKGLHKTDAAAEKAHGVFSRLGRVLTMNAAGFHHVSMMAGEAHSKIGEFLEFVGAEAAVEVLKEIGEKVFEIGEEAVRAAAKAERINRVIDISAGGKEMGETTRKWLEDFSKASEFAEEVNEKAYIGLKRMGVGQQQAGLFMKAAADIAAVSENKQEAYEGAISAFQRMQITGRVQARTLMPLGIGVQDFKKLDRFKGMSSKQVNQALAKEAEVNQGELFQLIMSRAGEKKIGTRSADNVDLISTKMEKLSELPERFFKKLANTQAVGTLAHALDGVLEKLDPESPSGKALFGALEGAFTGAAEIVDSIDFAKWGDVLANDVVPFMKEMVADAKAVLAAVGKTVEFLSEIPGIKQVGNAIGNRMADRAGLSNVPITDRMKGFDYEAAKARLHAMKAAAPGGGTGQGVGAATGATVKAWHGAMQMVGSAAGDGLAEGLDDGRKAAGDAATRVAGEAPKAARKVLKVQSPSVVFEDIGAMAAAGYTKGLRGGAGDVEDAVRTTLRVGGPAAGAGGARGGGVTIQLNTTIHAGGGTGRSQGKELAEGYNEQMVAQLISALERAGLRGGAG